MKGMWCLLALHCMFLGPLLFRPACSTMSELHCAAWNYAPLSRVKLGPMVSSSPCIAYTGP